MIHSLWRYSQLYCQVYTLRNSNMAAHAAFFMFHITVRVASRYTIADDYSTTV